jgi:hypothetical protein
MAALDRRLAQAERCATRLCGRGGMGEGAPSGAEAADLPEPDSVTDAGDRSDADPAPASPPRGKRRRG